MQTQHQRNIDPTRPNHPVTEKQTSFEDNTKNSTMHYDCYNQSEGSYSFRELQQILEHLKG